LHEKKNNNHLSKKTVADFAPKEEIVKRKEERLVDAIPVDLEQYSYCNND